MRNYFVVLFLSLSVLSFAQNKKVAVMETKAGQGVTTFQSNMIRGGMETAIANADGYEGFDRSAFDMIMQEQNFQRSGAVDDAQIKELGQMAGVQYILVTEAESEDGYLYILAKLLDIETGKYGKAHEKLCEKNPPAIKKACGELGELLFEVSQSERERGMLAKIRPQKNQQTKQAEPEKQVSQPVQVSQPMQVSQPVSPVNNALAATSQTPLTTMPDGTVVYVAMDDESEKLNYEDAVSACNCKGDGWRLPTLAELKIIERNKKTYGNLNTSFRYWAIEGDVTIDMSTGYKVTTKKSVKAKVRCVKEVKK